MVYEIEYYEDDGGGETVPVLVKKRLNLEVAIYWPLTARCAGLASQWQIEKNSESRSRDEGALHGSMAVPPLHYGLSSVEEW